MNLFLVIITIRHRNFTPENYKFNEGDGNWGEGFIKSEDR